MGRVGFPGAPLEQNAGAEKSPRHPSRRVRGSRCLCYAFPGREGRCPWCSLSRVSQRGRCPCMSPCAVHGKLLGVVVVGGRRRRAVFWQAGGSRRLPELDEARKGVACRPCRVRCVLRAVAEQGAAHGTTRSALHIVDICLDM